MEFTYHADVLRVIDGDTIEVKLDLGFHIYRVARVRLYGVDTPEVRGPEKPQGLVSKAFVEQMIGGKHVSVITVKESDKYGRVLARINYNDTDLATALLEHGLAEVYPKPKRISILRSKRVYWRRKVA